MKKIMFAAALAVCGVTAWAQEPNIPMGMFGAPQTANVNFDPAVAGKLALSFVIYDIVDEKRNLSIHFFVIELACAYGLVTAAAILEHKASHINI